MVASCSTGRLTHLTTRSRSRFAAARTGWSDERRRASPCSPPQLVGAGGLGAVRCLSGLRRLASGVHARAVRGRPRARREVPVAPLSARLPPLGAPAQGHAREPADRGGRLCTRRGAVAPAFAHGGAEPNAAVAHVAGAARDGSLPFLPPRDCRDPVRQGGRLRRARRHPRADRRLGRVPREALHRGDRGDLAQAGRGDPRERCAVPVGRKLRGHPAGVLALRRLHRLRDRRQLAQFHDGQDRRRERHRRDAVRRVPALRFRLRLRDCADDHRADHGERSAHGPHQADLQGMSAPGIAAIDREWHRFTPAERFARFAVYFAVVAAIVVSLETVEMIPEFVYDAPAQIGDMLRRMWPVAWGFYPDGVQAPLLDSLHIATLGTVLAVVMAVPVAFLAARNVTPHAGFDYLAKLVLVSARSVSTLIWALFFVAVFGPGALAGTLAIAFHSIGFTAKLLSEALEETNRGTIEALHATGALWLSVALQGYWPQVKPAFWSIVLFRWDINVRESAVLGLVGAGGVGMALDTALNLFQWDRVAIILLAIFAVVIIAEIAVTAIRQRII